MAVSGVAEVAPGPSWTYRRPSTNADAKSRWTLESSDGLVAQVVRSRRGWRCEVGDRALRAKPRYDGHVFVPAPPVAYCRTAKIAMNRVEEELAAIAKATGAA